MVEYTCFRCGYKCTHKGNFRNHLNRKNICSPLHEDISIENIKNMYNLNNPTNSLQITPNNSKITPNYQNMTPLNSLQITPNNSKLNENTLQITPNNSKLNENPSKITPFGVKKATCEYCQRNFTRKDNLTKHLKICKSKKKNEELVLLQSNKIMEMEEEIKKLKMNQIHQTNNNITNNINNTININNYGDENLKHLRSRDFANLLNGIYSAVPKLIEKIHFDPEHPENQNIKYTNKKLPYLKIMKNNKWQFVSKKDELLDLIDNKCFMLKEKYYEILEKNKCNITEIQRNKIEEFMNKYHEDDKKMTLDLFDKTELLLLNNS